MEFMYVVMFALGLAVVIAWIVLPFAIIGTKPILTELLAETKRTNTLLAALAERNVPTLTRVA